MALIQFMPMTDLQHEKEVLLMMRGLYREDAAALPVDSQRSQQVIRTLVEHPGRGRIVLFVKDENIYGYAILIPYLSNEFGGTVLFIDEIFVKPLMRWRRIARHFFELLRCERPFDAVALALEVSPTNLRARRLYESIGFESRPTSMLVRRLS